MTAVGGENQVGTLFKVTLSGNLTTLHTFAEGEAGWNPASILVLGKDGNFYGATHRGGTNDEGVIFKATPEGEVTTLYSFTMQYAKSALALGPDGMFYGTTFSGGANDNGTVYKISLTGEMTTLYNF
jgi:uncharacterized repeat protein (TIGR03803 family)